MTAVRINQNILDQAYAWVVALRGENVSEKSLEDFSVWLTSAEAHESAWDQALELWETMGAVSHLPLNELLANDPV